MAKVSIEVPDEALKEAAEGKLADLKKDLTKQTRLATTRHNQIQVLKQDIKELKAELNKPNEVVRKATALVEALSEALNLEVTNPADYQESW